MSPGVLDFRVSAGVLPDQREAASAAAATTAARAFFLEAMAATAKAATRITALSPQKFAPDSEAAAETAAIVLDGHDDLVVPGLGLGTNLASLKFNILGTSASDVASEQVNAQESHERDCGDSEYVQDDLRVFQLFLIIRIHELVEFVHRRFDDGKSGHR